MSHFLQNLKDMNAGIQRSRQVAGNVLSGTMWGMQRASGYAGDIAGKGAKSIFEMVKADPTAIREGITFKNLAKGAAFSGAMYGLSAFMTDNPQNAASDRMVNYGKHGIAAGIDVASDTALSAVAMGIAGMGPVGAVAGAGIMAYNMFAGFVGMDTGSLAMNLMNQFDQRYEDDKRGPKFEMTQNTSMALQRQIQNLHASGSNLGEMMHN